MSSITPISTKYQGQLFRSRLEARWAVFFEHAGGIFENWQYEPEGYVLPGNIWYLPDFWLPHAGCFVEVKPETLDSDKWAKARLLAKSQNYPVLLLEGPPQIRSWWLAQQLEMPGEWNLEGEAAFTFYEERVTYKNWKAPERFWHQPGDGEVAQCFAEDPLRSALVASKNFRPDQERF